MTIVLPIIGACIFVFLVLKWASVVKRHKAAVNVLLAKHAYEKLGNEEKQRVHKQTANILAELLSLEHQELFCNEAEKFGWYALAMAELGIPPAIKAYCYPGWYFVKNPYIAIFPTDSMFAQVSRYLKHKHGVAVTISSYDKRIEEYKRDS